MSKRGRAGEPPLYAKIRDVLLDRVRSGALAPGQLLPNEFELAAELGVSQGTVRRALDTLTRERIVVRRQGSGTFVAVPDPDEWLFRYFNIYDEAGRQVTPDSIDTLASTGLANKRECERLGLGRNARVVRVTRRRTHNGVPFIAETLVLPADLFAGLAERAEIPNTVYDLMQRDYGVLVGRGDERVTAVAAGSLEADLLSLSPGTPLIRIDRVVYAIDGRAVEWRVSLCHLTEKHYRVRLT